MPRRRADDREPATVRPRASARLSREAIVAAAVALADRDGLDRLSMRRLGQELGADPMSVYHHLRDKGALLEAMVDAVVAGITPDDSPDDSPDDQPAWTDDLRALILGARRTMLRHPWAVRVLQERATPTPATLRHLDRVLGAMRRGGCSVELSHHALHLLGSRVLGFSQDLFDDSPDTRADPADLAAQFGAWAEAYPHVVELAFAVSHDGGLGGCDDDAEFAFALDLLLDGLERRRRTEGDVEPPGSGLR